MSTLSGAVQKTLDSRRKPALTYREKGVVEMGIRTDRVQRQLAREIAIILQEDLKDPRLNFVSVTRIELAGDLRHANVYFSTIGDEHKQKQAVEGIKSAAGFIRKLVGGRLRLRYVPELSFKLDRSIEYSIELEKTFERLQNERIINKKGHR